MILTRILHDSCTNHARYVKKSGKFMQESCKKSCMILVRFLIRNHVRSCKIFLIGLDKSNK